MIGIDPGASGAVAWLDQAPCRGTLWIGDQEFDQGPLEGVRKFSDLTERDIADLFKGLYGAAGDGRGLMCYIERVHSFPGQGVSSSFSFGQQYGFLRGLLIGLGLMENSTPKTLRVSHSFYY